MTREEALKVWRDSIGFNEVECSSKLQEAISVAFREMEKARLCIYPKEITFDDVQRYCRPRCLTIITDELLHELIQPPKNTVCKSLHIVGGKYECCFAEKGQPVVHCGGDKKKCEILDEEQKSVLDKIRAELENAAFDSQEIDGEHETIMIIDLTDALNIIDKYIKESEE